MTDEVWDEVLESLKLGMSENSFTNWIEPLSFVGIGDQIARFGVPTGFFGNYVDQNFGDQILFQFNKLGLGLKRLQFDVLVQRAPKPQAASKPVYNLDNGSGAPIDARFTFDSFVVGKPNELANAAARRVAEGGPVTFNPLFLYGGVGLGKTHLMHAIANEIAERDPGKNVLYISAEQFMYRFITALRERKMMDFKQMFRSVDVLMVDDVQFIAGKDST